MPVIELDAVFWGLGGRKLLDRGEVKAVYWAGGAPYTTVVGKDVVTPSRLEVPIVGGEATAELSLLPTDGSCCVRWTVEHNGSREFGPVYTTVPDVESVVFGDLPRVDPETFAPTDPTPTLIETIRTNTAVELDAQKGAPEGVAGLGADGVVPESQIPERLGETALSATFVAAFPVALAVGDGVTDDTAAIQAVIDTAATFGGGSVTLKPGGVYLVSGLKLRTGVTLDGQTRTSRLDLAPNATQDAISLFDVDVTNAGVRNLSINGRSGNQVNPVGGINFTHTGGTVSLIPRHQIFNVHIRHCKGTGLNLGDYTRGVSVNVVSVYFCDGYGVILGGADSTVSNVDIGQSGKAGLYITGSAYQVNAVKSWYSGRLDSTMPGFHIANHANALTNCFSQENKGAGFHLFRSGTTLFDVNLSGCVSDSDNTSGGTYPAFNLFNVKNSSIDGTATSFAHLAGKPFNGVTINGGSAGNDVRLTARDTISALSAGPDLAANRVVINGQTKPKVTVTAAELRAVSGAPDYGWVGTGGSDRVSVMRFDAAAAEYAGSVIALPDWWANAKITLVWTNTDATSGDVRWGVSTNNAGPGESIIAAPTSVGVTAPAPATAGVLVYTVLAASVPASGEVLAFRVQRNGVSVEDTLANDAGLIAVIFEQV